MQLNVSVAPNSSSDYTVATLDDSIVESSATLAIVPANGNEYDYNFGFNFEQGNVVIQSQAGDSIQATYPNEVALNCSGEVATFSKSMTDYKGMQVLEITVSDTHIISNMDLFQYVNVINNSKNAVNLNDPAMNLNITVQAGQSSNNNVATLNDSIVESTCTLALVTPAGNEYDYTCGMNFEEGLLELTAGQGSYMTSSSNSVIMHSGNNVITFSNGTDYQGMQSLNITIA